MDRNNSRTRELQFEVLSQRSTSTERHRLFLLSKAKEDRVTQFLCTPLNATRSTALAKTRDRFLMEGRVAEKFSCEWTTLPTCRIMDLLYSSVRWDMRRVGFASSDANRRSTFFQLSDARVVGRVLQALSTKTGPYRRQQGRASGSAAVWLSETPREKTEYCQHWEGLIIGT